MQRFDLAAIEPTRWKNGGGATRELACWPPGADLENFGWRVSAARISQSGPFSVFHGVDRQILLLLGEGVRLGGPGIDHRLDTPWEPFAFAGETLLHCQLLGGACSDLNLMLRRGAWRGGVEVLRQRPASCGAFAAGLCLVLAGAWRAEQDGDLLTHGQGLWWSAPGAPQLAPATPAGCVLACIGLKPHDC